MQGHPWRSLALATLSVSLAACRGGDGAGNGNAGGSSRPDREWTDAARVEAIASSLQACSYDGSPAKVQAGQLNGQAPADCRDMVDRIMGYTGLPANFVVTSGPVPNALAVILPDQQRIPQRVIAFNPDFIDATRRVTGGGQWGPVSIMAHEIGHHLSGHTITAGGSRPGLELEADKFSGYVLYKMGAPLSEATKAVDAIASETEQVTHPARARRVVAITQGWQEACRQDGGNCAAGAAATPAATPPSGVAGGKPLPPARVATLPAPAADAVPFKFGRFVVDETGKLNAASLARLDAKLFALAREKGVEFAVLFVNDLHGLSPDDYAWAMMRQLRIGKLDLGNGGVIVIAPGQGVSGGAFAPGVAKKLEFFDPRKRFDSSFRIQGWQRSCPGSDACAGFTNGLVDVVDRAVRDLDTTWQIRFESIEAAIARSIAAEDARAAARKAGKQPQYDQDMPNGSLVRFTATVTDVAPKTPPADPQTPQDLAINRHTVTSGGWNAVLVKTPEGQETTLYMQPRTPSLMPSGKLQVGKQYTFVGEIKSTGRFHTNQGVVQTNPGVWLFSYEAL